ncbi:hypothetical protein ES702_06501 [subsurface metagenome]
MGLVQPFMVKNVLGNTNLELEAKPGESLLVKDILTHYCASSYCTITIDKTTVGYFRQSGTLGAHIFRLMGWQRHAHRIRIDAGSNYGSDATYPIRHANNSNSKACLSGKAAEIGGDTYDIEEAMNVKGETRQETLLTYLKRKGIWNGYPIAEGETLKITGVAATNAKQVLVYEVHEAGDMAPETPNGSKSNVYMFLNYGNCGASINTNGDSLFTTSQSPAEFPAFPFGAVVPAKHEIEVLGICASPFAPKENDNTNYIFTRYLKMVKDRTVLFDDDRNGIIFDNRQLDLSGRVDSVAQGFSLIGNKSEYDANEPLMFDPPLKFVAGDELNIYVTTVAAGTGQNITTTEHEICLIERVTRLE